MLGSDVVAVKGMHNHPPRALGVPARRTPARKQYELPATAAAVTAATVVSHSTLTPTSVSNAHLDVLTLAAHTELE